MSKTSIQFVDLQRQYKQYKNGIDRQIRDVIKGSSFIMGSHVRELEDLLGKFVGVKHAIGCSSGTDALRMALMAFGVRSGDEIITTPFTFIATCEAIAYFNAKPVFVDIDETYNIDAAQIKKAITCKTKGIIAVDMFGQCADFDTIRTVAGEHGLFVIEDAAQSFGARYKKRPSCSLADIACTSFFPAKPLGCYGDGGMMFTNDDKKAEFLRSVSLHGKGREKYDHIHIGLNGRLDTLQAAILIEKFRHLPQEIEKRNRIADRYTKGLSRLKAVTTPNILADNSSVYAQYSIRIKERDALMDHLKKNNIPTAIHYPKPVYLQGAFSFLGIKEGSFPKAEETCRSILSLPMHPFLLAKEMDEIIRNIRAFVEKM